jgi:formylglycine-generating enzyme required for sulfatase activity
MMQALSPSPGPAYCVDATEVRNTDYAAFLAATPPVASQPSYCAFNTSFTPTSGWPATTVPNRPVAFVDWCDAYAYCAWAGKRLCGKIGGGASAVADGANASTNQWYSACSQGGVSTFPYGNNWQSGYCNDYWNGVGSVIDVGSDKSCVGGFPGIYDMTGNVWEWEDACTASAGASDSCNMRGGGFDTKTTPNEHCGYWTGQARSATAANLGFRCCRD